MEHLGRGSRKDMKVMKENQRYVKSCVHSTVFPTKSSEKLRPSALILQNMGPANSQSPMGKDSRDLSFMLNYWIPIDFVKEVGFIFFLICTYYLCGLQSIVPNPMGTQIVLVKLSGSQCKTKQNKKMWIWERDL